MNRTFFFRIVVSLLLATALEVFVFNFSALQIRMDPSLEANQIFTLEDMEAVNWTQEGDGYISKDDPQLFFQTDGPQRIKTVNIQFNTEPIITSAQFFYTDETGAVQVITLTGAESGSVSCQVEIATDQLLRIDLGDFAGTRLSDITVTLNSSVWQISISRIIAVVLIYICGSLLFRLQRMPDYHLERKSEEVPDTSSEGEP